MKWKEFSRDYLAFSRKERIGLLVIIVLITGIWILPKLATPGKPKEITVDSSWMIAAKKLQHMGENPETVSKISSEHSNKLFYDSSAIGRFNDPKGKLFYFDPNTLTFDGWRKLGLREKTIATIQKYISKGGHFFKTEDLKKIYSIYPNEYERLKPYIKIEVTKSQKDLSSGYIENEHKKDQWPDNNIKHSSVDINAADTSLFIALPGIGSKLASRIVNFRDRLGGFYSIDQIRELYGLPDSTFQKIKPFLKLENASVKKIKINSATRDEMKLHPYLRWNLANAIVEYRTQHGNYIAADDLKKISLVTEEMFAKIKPYISVE